MYIKENQEKISGLTAIDHMSKGKLVYSEGGAMRRIQNNRLEVSYDKLTWKESRMLMSEFLNPNCDWYAEPAFDVRTEMLAHPNECVGKYYDNVISVWKYVGFDKNKMIPIQFSDIKSDVNHDSSKNKTYVPLHSLDRAVPLSNEELKMLAAFKSK